MQSSVTLALTTADRWLVVFSLTAVVVLVGCTIARRAARRVANADGNGETRGENRKVRRRSGPLIAIGLLIGLALAPSPSTLTLVAALGAVALALVGLAVEQTRRADRLTMAATLVAAAIAVVAGARFGPTGVDTLDVVFAFVFIVVVTQAADGLGHSDALAVGIGATSAAGLFALAAFGHQDSLAAVALGLVAACFAFLAFNLTPASLYVGRGDRLAIGYTLAVGVLAVHEVPGAARSLVTPLMLVAVLLLDATVVVIARLRRRQPLAVHRPDHLVHRLAVLGWTRGEAVILLVIAQLVLCGIGVFTGRAVMPLWLGCAAAGFVLLVLAVEVARAKLERDGAPGFSLRVKLVIGACLLVVAAGLVPIALVANDARSLMQDGREAATRGLSAARDGDTVTAGAAFQEAALTFARARDKLKSPFLSSGLAVPLLAPNVRAARTLSQIGTDLANAGESVTAAVDPDALQVVDGRLPLEEIRKITPTLRDGAAALSHALQQLDTVRSDIYLAPPVRDAVDKVHTQLARAALEAEHAADAAELAPALFGGDGPRTYLLVLQNNAEARAAGGLIGNYGLITAQDGKLDVGFLSRAADWNNPLRAQPNLVFDAPTDYLNRYTPFLPATTLQNITLSPDFPSVAQALMGLAPQAGLPKVDGVMAVDPAGLGALLQLTGPINVEGWPTPITSENVVKTTLSDAYAVFENLQDREGFLGSVAETAVDKATSGTLGKPSQIAKVLGAAAHDGHIFLAFVRPEEQRLAVELGVSGKMEPVRSDALALTTSNLAGNKLDYYLHRDVAYSVHVDPGTHDTSAHVSGSFSVTLENTAPAEGLPQYVIGPSSPNFAAGENSSFVSIYSPLRISGTQINGTAATVAPAIERGRNVYSLIASIPSLSKATINTHLAGHVALHDGWYEVVMRHQATLNADRVRVSIDVPDGWRIDKTRGMDQTAGRIASAALELQRNTTFAVHLVRDPGTWNLWTRLQDGR